MGIITGSGGIAAGGALDANGVPPANTTANPGFIVTGATAAGNTGQGIRRDNYLAFNGFTVREVRNIRQSPNTSVVEANISGEADTSGVTRVWYGSNSATFGLNGGGNARTTLATGDAGQPRSVMRPSIVEWSLAKGEPASSLYGWSLSIGNSIPPAGTLLRVEVGAFPSLGSAITANNITMSGSGAFATGSPVFQVRLPLVGTPAQSGTHRVTLGNIPGNHQVDGNPVPNLSGTPPMGKVVETLRVTNQAVNREFRYNISTGTPTAPTSAAMLAMTTNHEFFADVPMSIGAPHNNIHLASDVDSNLGISGANAQYRPSAGDVRVSVPLTGSVAAGTYYVAVESDEYPELNYERTIVHAGGSIARTLTFDLETQNPDIDLINVEGLKLSVEISYVDPSQLPKTNIARVNHDTGFWAQGEAVQVGGATGELVITGTVGRPANPAAGTYRVRVLHTTSGTPEIVGFAVFSVAAGATLDRTFSATMPSPTGFADNYLGLTMVIDFFPDITDSLTGVYVVGNVLLVGDEVSVTTRVTGTATAEGVYVITLTYDDVAITGGSRTFSLHNAPVGNPLVRGGTFIADIPSNIDVDPALLGYDIAFHPSATVAASTPVGGMTAKGMAHLNFEADFITFAGTLEGNAQAGMYTVRVYSDGTRLSGADRLINVSAPEPGANRGFSIVYDHTTLDFPDALNFRVTFEPNAETLDGPVISAPTKPAIVNGVSVSDSSKWSLPPGTDGTATVNLTGTVGRAGFYNVELFFGDTPLGAPQMQRFAHGASANTVMLFNFDRADVSGISKDAAIEAELTFISAENFFYSINYDRETVSFGETFRVQIGDAFVPVRREQISYLVVAPNKVAKFKTANNAVKGKWLATGTGEVDVSRSLKKGGVLVVRAVLPGRNPVIVEYIDLPARPNAKTLLPKTLRKEIYNFRTQRFENTSDQTLEVKIGNDRGFFSSEILATERLAPWGADKDNPAPGSTKMRLQDNIPNGTPGTYRIAHEQPLEFLMVKENGDDVLRSVRDLFREAPKDADGKTPTTVTVTNDKGETVVLTNPADSGSFSSAVVKFKFPKQGNAPATTKMIQTPGKNGAPSFIGGTNNKMKVALVAQGDNPRTEDQWARMFEEKGKNITVAALLKLFENHPGMLETVEIDGNDKIVIEIRTFTEKNGVQTKPDSAPAYLVLDASVKAGIPVRATVRNIVVGGANGTLVGKAIPNRTNVVINSFESFFTADAGVITVEKVNDWFTNLPDGLSVSAVVRNNNTQVTVTISGTPTEESAALLAITIPAEALVSSDVDVTVTVNDGAKFNILPAPPDTGAPAPVIRESFEQDEVEYSELSDDEELETEDDEEPVTDETNEE